MGVQKSENVAQRSEKKIGKAKPITLLSIICGLMAFLILMTFLRFPIGIKNYNSVVGAIDLDYDIVGGTAYTLTLSEDNIEEVEDVEGVLETLRFRMRELGYDVFSVKALKSAEIGVEDYDIRIEAKSKDSLAQDIQVAAAFGELNIVGGSGTETSGYPQILEEVDLLESAKYLGPQNDGESTVYLVGITFTEQAYDELIALIREAASGESSTNFYMGINVGETPILSEGVVQESTFTNRMVYVNAQTEASAKQIALQLSSGGLAYKYDVSDAVSVTSPYGEDVALNCLLIILAILAVAFVYFAFAYKGLGLIMSLSLLAFALLETLMFIAVPGITLSIGGVIGFGLAIVLTAGSLMFICNSIKQEFVNTQKTVKAAVKKGFKDTLISNVGIFVAGGIVSALLLIFATGALKCFAITFGIGMIIGVIASLVFSRMFAYLVLPIADYSEKFLGVKRVGGEE